MASLEDQLEQLRGLINASIDIVQQDLHAHNDPPLNLSVSKRHPIRDRYNYDVARALKCISSSGLMLRALCDAEEAVHDVIFGVRITSNNC